MGRTDWDHILSIDPSSLTDDDMEDLYPAMISCDVDEINDVHNLRTLMKMSQEILQYKDNQVESLLLECSELKQTVSSLKPEPAKRKKKEWDTAGAKHETNGISKHMEVSESTDYDDVLQGKNKKIKILMAELETLERDNIVLKEQLATLTQEMEDATQKMNEMTEELGSTYIKSTELKEKILHLEHENAALVAQIEEITAQQLDRDRVIDEFGTAIDARINEWKVILNEKDTEIQRLKENLSQSLVQSVASAKEQSKTEIVHLNEEIDHRDKIIIELKKKLSEAIVEINEGAMVIEKLKKDAQKAEKHDNKKEHKELIKKLQDANEKLSSLEIKLAQAEEDAQLRSSKLCEVLATLRKYKDENQGLTDALNEIKELKSDLKDKSEHIKDLINVVNKLEMLNSYQEMEIITLREKLGIPEHESVSVQHISAKRKEEEKKLEELLQQNKMLLEENLELKSDIRVLKYRLTKSLRESDFSGSNVNGSLEFLHSTKLVESEPKNIFELKQNMQLVIEENEALRTGMHEILDSIRNQDGKSIVEIQSSTLERLLEALDVRHLAGWYHPAMRLQEHLNVVQGSNVELRGQIKQLRKELKKKDSMLQSLTRIQVTNVHEHVDESDSEKATYAIEMNKLQETYKSASYEWETQKNSLLEQNEQLKNEIEKLKLQLEIYEQSAKTFEEGEDEVRKAVAVKTKEYVEAASELLIMNRKYVALQQLLNRETTRMYQQQKEAIKNEHYLRKSLTDTLQRNKLLERELSIVQSNLSNSISNIIYNELRDKHDELNIRFRNLLENTIVLEDVKTMETLKSELEMVKREKEQLMEHLQTDLHYDSEQDLRKQLKESLARELLEKQRADHINNLHEILQSQLKNCEENLKEAIAAKSELQEELIALHKRLSKDLRLEKVDHVDDNQLQELKDNVATLQTENENLKGQLQIVREEAEQQYFLNSLNTMELDSLRHQILDLQAASEDKATISRLDFELASKKISEMELNAQKTRIEKELSYQQEELEKWRTTCDELRVHVQDCRRQCENRCRTYTDIIGFLQNLYAGSTSISSLDRVVSLSLKLKEKHQQIDVEMKKAMQCHEDIKQQQEMLTNRLQIVESLKQILEQQIGSNGAQDILQSFSEYSQYTLNDFKNKRKIMQLEHELQTASKKFTDYESIIATMEHEMIRIQKIWSKGQEQRTRIDTRSVTTSPMYFENRHMSIQVTIQMNSVEVQTDPYTCCLEKKEIAVTEVQTSSSTESAPKEYSTEATQTADTYQTEDVYSKKEAERIQEKSAKEEYIIEEKETSDTNEYEVSVLRDQLNQALKLASERSSTLIKYEMQVVECQTKMDALNRIIESKDVQLTEKEKLLEEYKLLPHSQLHGGEYSDKVALKSTINSLQKLLSQKEETIARYQNLLKEDRDEHSKAAARLQDEIRSLQARVQSLQSESKKVQSLNEVSDEPEKLITSGRIQEIIIKSDPTKRSIVQTEEVIRLQEKVSTLEADLNVTKELSERWHRLAEERLKHMDRMRERLEEQHKSELESYHGELKKWQSEADTLRKQLSENRVLITKGNISLMKELQEKDDKIHELSLACQQLQNAFESMETTTRSQRAITHGETESRIHEIAQTFARDQTQQNAQTELLKKQLQSLLEKEKTYKNEISDLKQQLSRRYMAVKMQEKKTSQREVQLERKVKSLEEELEKAKAQLDREYLAQETKRAKTAEELLLWDKQKKWQQTAEKLKEKLKEKTDEYTKLLSNYEKLRSVVSCMEREKWYLKSKLKSDNNTMAGSLSARPLWNTQQNLMEELQKECQTLRDRIKELTDRLENEDNEKLLLKIDEQKRRIAALEVVSQGNDQVVGQLEKLEMTKDILEKMNLTLEAENFELRLELEKANAATPRLREKVDHLQRYIELLKVEKSSDSTPRSLDKDVQDQGLKKSTVEMERTIFTLKRIIEKLQAENKRLKLSSKKNHLLHPRQLSGKQTEGVSQQQYEEAQKRIVALETDLQLAEHKVAALERVQKDDDNGEIKMLREQLNHKSELLDKMKHLLTRAAMNEKTLRQRVQQLESKQALTTIPECHVTPSIPE